MTLSFLYLISSIQILNTLSKTIMSLLRPIIDDISIKNIIFMVKTTGVRGTTLAQVDSVLVWQRAVNRPPGSRSDNS